MRTCLGFLPSACGSGLKSGAPSKIEHQTSDICPVSLTHPTSHISFPVLALISDAIVSGRWALVRGVHAPSVLDARQGWESRVSSNIQHPTSNIPSGFPTRIPRPISHIPHRVSHIAYPTSHIPYRTSHIPHLTSHISYLLSPCGSGLESSAPSEIEHQTSDICSVSLKHPTSHIPYLLSPQFLIRHSLH